MAAYKGLLKEKEALEASLSALNVPNEKQILNDATVSTTSSSSDTLVQSTSSDTDLKIQIGTLMNSLATLSAEKSRMEASFQADKKQMRQELQAKDKVIKDLNDKMRSLSVQHANELEKSKSKLIVERHDREKEANDHMIMVRELQKLLSDERHLKDNLEMQLNDLKIQFSKSDFGDVKVKELTMELEQAKKKLKEMKTVMRNQNVAVNSDSLGNVKQLQSEIQSMKQQHLVNLKIEQRRANLAEEVNRKMAAVHEEKVALLEERLAELSSTVGSYDRLRQIDQDNIFKLRDKIAQFEINNVRDDDDNDRGVTKINPINSLNVELLIEEMLHLKKVLLVENAKLECPQDLSKIFSNADDHTECIEELRSTQEQYTRCKKELEMVLEQSIVERKHIKTLQDKIQVLNRNIDEQEEELKRKATEYANELRLERKKWKETNSLAEMDYRGKLAQLEQQLQKQRERSLVLLEEKEHEIKALKTSFEVLIPSLTSIPSGDDVENANSDNVKPGKYTSTHLNSILSTPSGSTSNHSSEYHMLHYVHELSRKEVEITSLRKAKHLAESSLRQALQDKVTQQQDLHDRIMNLEENIDR